LIARGRSGNIARQGATLSEHAIVDYTETIARQIAVEHADAPLEELRLWVRLAHQREAMVTELYDLSQIDGRLEKAPPTETGEVIRAAIASIWSHETAHAKFLESVRGINEDLVGLAELQGRLEGRVTRGAVSDGGTLARFLIAVGVSLKRAPAFAAELRRMDLRQLMAFYAELETTAKMGYERILVLRRTLGDGPGSLDFGVTFLWDVARILQEERFHEDAFRAIARWVAADGDRFLPLPARECVETLHDLCARNLSTPTVARAVDPGLAIPKGHPLDGDATWVSDGGLGELFSRFGLATPVDGQGRARAGLLPA
jgi:hypothetical protein